MECDLYEHDDEEYGDYDDSNRECDECLHHREEHCCLCDNTIYKCVADEDDAKRTTCGVCDPFNCI
jgi:hypothetical protein